MNGRYKVLTNAPCREYHFVIYDEETGRIYDPTYEKYQDSSLLEDDSCKGTDCTLKKLGSSCVYFALNFYLDEFTFPAETRLVEQIKEAGERFKSSIGK